MTTPSFEEVWRLKREFLIHLDQEIRTPLASIMGLSDLLLESPLTEEQRQYVQSSRVCAEGLLETLSHALEYGALASGVLPLHEAEFNLRETLAGAVEKESPKAQAKGLKLSARLAKSLPAVAVGDAQRIEEVVRQLVRNAVEFTRQGEVEVAATCAPPAGDRLWLHVQVRDTGPGLAPEQLALIFEPFRQTEGGLARSHPGLGLGLAVVQKLVQLMDGEVAARSQPGRGTLVEVRVPLGRASSPAGGPPASPSQRLPHPRT
jgi:signal transduction histidine kinase